MAHTLSVPLSDTLVRRYSADIDIKRLRDPRNGLLLSYHQNRNRGTYHIRHYHQGQDRWYKIGIWPDLPVKVVSEKLPELRIRLAIDKGVDSIQISAWKTVGELLTWYRDRCATNSKLSEPRRTGIVSAINAQLLPRVGDLLLSDVTHKRIDTDLIWPLQASYELSYVRSIYSVMRTAFSQAARLNQIQSNPLSELVFSAFIQAKIQPKPAALKVQDLPGALERLPELPARRRLLPLLMLLHGTRITETASLRWDWIDWNAGEMEIPASMTKNRQEHSIPLTPLAQHLLREHKRVQRRYGQSVWLFPGSSGRPIDKNVANDLFKQLSDGAWTSHDLRKLARTRWVDMGVDYIVGEQLLNHKLKNLDAVYIHTSMQAQKRAALEQYHAWLQEIVPPEWFAIEKPK